MRTTTSNQEIKGQDQDPIAQQVRDWRHKLQRAFLGTKPLEAKDMLYYSDLFATVENFDKMTVEYLTYSKIGKVMRHIHMLDPINIPREDEFRFRDRAETLVNQWHQLIGISLTSVSSAIANAPAEDEAAALMLGNLTISSSEA